MLRFLLFIKKIRNFFFSLLCNLCERQLQPLWREHGEKYVKQMIITFNELSIQEYGKDTFYSEAWWRAALVFNIKKWNYITLLCISITTLYPTNQSFVYLECFRTQFIFDITLIAWMASVILDFFIIEKFNDCFWYMHLTTSYKFSSLLPMLLFHVTTATIAIYCDNMTWMPAREDVQCGEDLLSLPMCVNMCVPKML